VLVEELKAALLAILDGWGGAPRRRRMEDQRTDYIERHVKFVPRFAPTGTPAVKRRRIQVMR
jgi:hypothetical protein